MIKLNTKTKVIALLSLILLVMVILTASRSGQYSQASAFYYTAEDKHEIAVLDRFEMPTLDRNFRDDRIQIILRHRYSQITQIYLSAFQIASEIEFVSIQDTWTSEEGLEINLEKARRQLLSIQLKQPCKNNVLTAIEDLMRLDKVLIAQPSFIYEIRCLSVPSKQFSNIAGSNEWGLEAVSAKEAWNISTGNSNVKVGIMESGGAGQHADFLDSNGVSRLLPQLNPNKPALAESFMNHGTQVAGVVGAIHNEIGAAGIAQVSMVPIFVHATSGAGMPQCNFVEMLGRAALAGIRVINASFYFAYRLPGSPTQTIAAPKNEAHYEALERFNGVLVAAAGNLHSRGNNDTRNQFPANYSRYLDNVISVGATMLNNNGEEVRWNDYNNIYASQWGANSVDLFAPGHNILTTCLFEGTARLRGTSVAAPFVSGVAGILLSIDNNLSGADIRNIINNNVDVLPSLNGLARTNGRLNAHRAISSLFFQTNNAGNTIEGFNFTPEGNQLTIPSKINGVAITHIGNNAFAGQNFTSVSIPASVIRIGDRAFEFNTNLRRVYINRTYSQGITTLGNGVFSNTPVQFVAANNPAPFPIGAWISVPPCSQWIYRTSAGWSEFERLITDEPIVIQYVIDGHIWHGHTRFITSFFDHPQAPPTQADQIFLGWYTYCNIQVDYRGRIAHFEHVARFHHHIPPGQRGIRLYARFVQLINNAEDLMWLTNEIYNGNQELARANFIMTNDIQLNGSKQWTPIGSVHNPFRGTFNGNGFSITGIQITGGLSNIGLFGVIDGGHVSNIIIEQSNIIGFANVGGIAGQLIGGGIIENSINHGTVRNIAGIAVGGIVGYVHNSSVIGVYNFGFVTSYTRMRAEIGGIAGVVSGNSVLTGNSNFGLVDGDILISFVGGIAGLVRGEEIVLYNNWFLSGDGLNDGLYYVGGWDFGWEDWWCCDSWEYGCDCNNWNDCWCDEYECVCYDWWTPCCDYWYYGCNCGGGIIWIGCCCCEDGKQSKLLQ